MAAAAVAEAGMDPMAFLAEESEPIRAIKLAVAAARDEMQRNRDENLAVQIANKVGKLFG